MIFVALRMLTGDRLKYLGLIIGITFSCFLVTQQASIFNGFATRTGNWIRDTGTFDLWVMDDQVEFADDFKPVSDNALNRVRSVEGVAWAVPMYKNYVKTRLPDGTTVQVRVVGLDDATLTGGPPQITNGTLELLRQDKAILVDEANVASSLRLLKPHNGEPPRPLRIGDRVDINDHEAVIVGTYRKSPEFFWDPVIYTTFSRAQTMAPPERRTTTFVLVKAAAGQDVADLARRIHSAVGLAAYTPEQFAQLTNNFILDRTGILVNFGMTVVLGMVIGILIAGQLLYAFVLENTRYFGTLKALGTSNRQLLAMVAIQAMVVSVLGFGIGVGMAGLSGIMLKGIGLAFYMSWQIPLVSAFAVLLSCGVAATISIARVMFVEPAIVFRN